jgi:predicted DNA-binding protein
MRAPAPTASGSGSAKPEARAVRVRSNRMPVQAPPDPTPHDPHAGIRLDARLDADTRQKVDELAGHFRRPRAAVLRHIMQWGLGQGHTAPLEQGESEGPVHHLHLYVDVELHKGVEQAAAALGVDIAPWLRHMVRQVTMTDFPASWQEARVEARSHDSPRYRERFMLRLDESSRIRLQALVEHFGVSKADIIRQLLAQATPDTFPASWHRRVAERHGAQVQSVRRRRSER